ncbi:MAG: ribonuclease III [Rhizobiaceae bacterium]|nr:ribonuclease III [Rhizobiaceae bacterium]
MPRRAVSVDEAAGGITALTGHTFSDRELLERALTHASARKGIDYQRLEFLGDRVLGLVISEMLFSAFPDAPEGELSVRLNALVNAETLAAIAEEIGLPAFIKTGSEIRALSGRKRVNVRADVTEALIAALYLDGGLDAARAFVRRHWAKRARSSGAARRDAKTQLQEWAHQVAGEAPTYKTEDRAGPDHDPLFTVSVKLKGYKPADATGRSKREAEQNAATALLVREGVWDKEGRR